jgi:Na+-translocating ferredoxin:NAD+ oxidoreductase RnfE subunit
MDRKFRRIEIAIGLIVVGCIVAGGSLTAAATKLIDDTWHDAGSTGITFGLGVALVIIGWLLADPRKLPGVTFQGDVEEKMAEAKKPAPRP